MGVEYGTIAVRQIAMGVARIFVSCLVGAQPFDLFALEKIGQIHEGFPSMMASGSVHSLGAGMLAKDVADDEDFYHAAGRRPNSAGVTSSGS